jgi:hypothetical protein
MRELCALKACWELEVGFRAFRTTAVVEVSGEFLVRSGLHSVLILWKVGW